MSATKRRVTQPIGVGNNSGKTGRSTKAVVPVHITRTGRGAARVLRRGRKGRTPRVFICYVDEPHLKKLEVWLAPFERSQQIKIWHRLRVVAGEDWRRQIDQQLRRSDIILMLVTPDFLASDFSYNEEVRHAIERHNAGTAKVIPIIVRPSLLKMTPLGALQALPKSGRPINQWATADAAWLDVIQGIEEAILALSEGQP